MEEGGIEFNNKGFHTLPSFYSGLSNAVLRSRAQSMKNGDPEKCFLKNLKIIEYLIIYPVKILSRYKPIITHFKIFVS